MFSLESAHRGDSIENTQCAICNTSIKKQNHTELSKICSCVIFSKGLKNEFEAAVDELLVFEPLKVCFIKEHTTDKPFICS